MARALKRIEVTVFNPRLTDQGWQFGGYPGADEDEDTLNGTRYMHNGNAGRSTVSGRATVPVLWGKQSGTIVNNESAEAERMLNRAFTGRVSRAGPLSGRPSCRDRRLERPPSYRPEHRGVSGRLRIQSAGVR